MLKDRKPRKVITHRIACGRPGTASTYFSALDHFEITSVERQDNKSLFPVDAAAMAKLAELGYSSEKPTRVPIRVDSDTIEDFLTQEYEARVMLPIVGFDGEPQRDAEGATVKRPQVWCHGDGVEATRGVGDATKKIPCCSSPFTYKPRTQLQMRDILSKKTGYSPDDGLRCPYAQNSNAKLGPACKPSTTMLVRCDAIANVGAMARVVSHGHNTADRLVSSLRDIKSMMPGGLLRNVPLDLVLVMKRIAEPGTSRSKLQPVLHVELRLPVEQTISLMQANLQASLQIEAGMRGLLASARVEAKDHGDEFPDVSAVVVGGEGGGNL